MPDRLDDFGITAASQPAEQALLVSFEGFWLRPRQKTNNLNMPSILNQVNFMFG